MTTCEIWGNDKECLNCGKRFTVLHPSRWAYKKAKGGSQYHYFCSWGCLRADEKKGSEEMRGEQTITPEQKARALEMAMDGESPLPFLKECGAANPSATWNYIRNCAVRDDPMKYEGKLPNTFGHKKKEKPAVELVYDPDIERVYREEQAEIAMREERGRRIAEKLDRADRARQEMIDGIEPLAIAAVYSRTIDGARFKKMDGGMMLVNSDYCIRLTAYEWFKLTEEILVAIRQLDATKAEIDN